jgi:type I restriction-modification system DNA methylase subunit
MPSSLETYIRELVQIRNTGAGVKETSYYTPLANLFNEIGKSVKPNVRCVMQLKNMGAGMPDGGLFTPDQFQKGNNTNTSTTMSASVGTKQLVNPQNPSRGVIEAKSTADDAWLTANSKQVTTYWNKYRQVLVTNYRDFLLIGQDANGNPLKLESYRLASSEAEFWKQATASPHALAQQHQEQFTEYLRRVMLQAAALTTPQDVAGFLASYARDARIRLEQTAANASTKSGLAALNALRDALEKALGIKFEGAKGEHFFRSTLVQTLFYGVFSAWVLWRKGFKDDDSSAHFDWRTAAYYLHVPIIQALFEEVSKPTRLGPLGLVEVLNWTGDALNRVDRTNFFARFKDSEAVQYFYEPFLEAFDPALRKELGVWYTPSEIVQYMVARVNTALREELGLEDGLADSSVYVLDPCCGTGAYLVEVLKQINTTLQDKGLGELAAQQLNQAARERVFGFEILPAPFVVAHLQLGLLLQNLGAPLNEAERAGIYLTNALTGWAASSDSSQPVQQQFPELEEEREAASEVKNKCPVLVVLGNPPYNAFAGVSPAGEQNLVEPYKQGLISEWGIKKFNLDDYYVRFFRIAERKIAEQLGKGIVSFISNYSWVSEPSFVVLRQSLLKSFNRIWIENMHGNRKISEYAPDGKTSETVFAISGFSPGIQQGVVISLWVKTGEENTGVKVLFRDDLNAAKATERRTQLLKSLQATDFDAQYTVATPIKTNRYSFRPANVTADYLAWPKITELSTDTYSNGLMEKRSGALISIDKAALENRMRMYYDPKVSWGDLQALQTGLTEDAAGFDAKKARTKIQAAESFKPDHILPYALRPFETRWCYFTDVNPLWNRSRPTLWAQCWEGNSFLLSRMKASKDDEGSPFYFAKGLSDDHILSPDATCFPIRLKSTPAKNKKGQQNQLSLLESDEPEITANLSVQARTYLSSLDISDPDTDAETAGLVWLHALAIGYAPNYLTANAHGIRQDWPRIPMPNTASLLRDSAKVGQSIAQLLDTEQKVAGVSSGALRAEQKVLGVLSKTGTEALNLAINAGWGHLGKEGVTMPGKGKLVERDYSPSELAALQEGATAQNLSSTQIHDLLGATTYDVYLNPTTYWKNVPSKVWDYTIGGYQVIKKWLSYREYELLQRPLSQNETSEVMNMVRRIAALLLLQPQLDSNYEAVVQNLYNWVS